MANLSKALTHHTLAGKALRSGNHKQAAHHLGHAMAQLRGNAPVQEGDEPDMADGDDTADERSVTGDMRGGSGQATVASKGKTTEPAPGGKFFGQFGTPASAPATPPRRPSAPGAPSPSKSKLAGLLKSIKGRV
jgi:hypothetical protein